VLTRLAELGIRIAIDDFGTGQSSLSYLHRLPATEVKIDKSFVKSMATDKDSLAIVRSIIGLGRSLGLDVVAEGIEDGDTWESLRTMGCEIAQGYHLSRPLSADRLVAFLATALALVG
jgi:EAL domain-containing protein (putative c-di-GMP-specific phosphodiesterase class I)